VPDPPPPPPTTPDPPPPPPPALPDLAFAAVGSSHVVVRNAGTAPTGPFVITITATASYTSPGLAPGALFSITFACRPTPRIVILDPANAIAESNEGNNAGAVPPC
jgi:hypothetical protein